MLANCPYCGSTQAHWKVKAQEWECQNCEERFEADPPSIAPDPLIDIESTCLHRAKALASNAGWGDAIEACWPGPVSYTYRLLRMLLRNGQVDAAALVFKDLAELLARLSALILAQDLIQHGPSEGVAAIREELFGAPPSMGVWVRLSDTWSRQAQNTQGLLFPELAALWRTSKGKRTTLNSLLSDHIVNWRNETIGHGVRGNDLGLTMRGLERYLGHGKQNIHAALLPFADLWNDVTLAADGHLLMGADSIRPRGQGEHTFAQDSNVLLRRRNRWLDLRPWISARCCQVCDQPEIFFYDSVRARKMIPHFRLINYENGHPYSLQGATDAQMLDHYSAVARPATIETREGFDRDSLPGEIARLLDEQSVERDYLSPRYLRDPLCSVVEASLDAHHGSVFWLQAPAHVGKSTFVRGLDPTYHPQFKEDPLLDGLSVAVFYIRREYQYHLGQFADQFRDKIKAALDIWAQNKPLPSLDIEHPGPEAMCTFLGKFQCLGRRPLLIVIDGLDELAEEHPSIVDYLPPPSMMPAAVTLLLTSRLEEELPAWIRAKTRGALQDAEVRPIGLDNAGYVALMDDYARSRLNDRFVLNDTVLKGLRDKSDGRFLYFAFLVQRIKDGDLKAEDISKLADPVHLVPQYLEALNRRYAKTASGNLLQRVLLWMTAAEEAHTLHNKDLPALAQRPWMGLPMGVLCQAVEGQPRMTPRLTHVLYLLKPLLATWRGDAGVALYRLGIRGLGEIVRKRYAVELDQLHDHLVRRLLAHQANCVASMSRTADLDWVASHLDGFSGLVSPQLREETRTDSVFRQALESLLMEFIEKGNIEWKTGHAHSALSSCTVSWSITEWLAGNSLLPKDQYNLLREQQAVVLNNRGNSLSATGDHQGALVSYTKAITIWNALREQLGTQFLPDMVDKLAAAFAYYGTELCITGDYQGALASYAKAIAIWEALREQLGIQSPPDISDRLAAVYGGRGDALSVTGDYQGALASYAEAIVIWDAVREELGTQFPPDMTDKLAAVYGGRANALSVTGDYQGALANYAEATGILDALREQLGTYFPPGMADSLAVAYLNRGAALIVTGDYQSALASYAEAITIWDALREHLGAQFISDMAAKLAAAYGGRGDAMSATGDYQGALASYAEAIAIWGDLRKQLGAQFLPDMSNRLAAAYGGCGNALRATGDYQEAHASYAEAIAIWDALREELGSQFPTIMAGSLARAFGGCGDTLSATGDYQEALASYAEAIAIWEALREQLGTQFLPGMAAGLAAEYGGRGDTLSATGDYQGALASYAEAIVIWDAVREELGAQFPPDMTDELAAAHGGRGNALSATGDCQGALASYAEAIAIWDTLLKQLGAQFPPGMAHNLAAAYRSRGDALIISGDRQGALAGFAAAIAIWEVLQKQLGVQFSSDMADGLATAYASHGDLLTAIGDHQGAIRNYAKANAIWEALRKQEGM